MYRLVALLMVAAGVVGCERDTMRGWPSFDEAQHGSVYAEPTEDGYELRVKPLQNCTIRAPGDTRCTTCNEFESWAECANRETEKLKRRNAYDLCNAMRSEVLGPNGELVKEWWNATCTKHFGFCKDGLPRTATISKEGELFHHIEGCPEDL